MQPTTSNNNLRPTVPNHVHIQAGFNQKGQLERLIFDDMLFYTDLQFLRQLKILFTPICNLFVSI